MAATVFCWFPDACGRGRRCFCWFYVLLPGLTYMKRFFLLFLCLIARLDLRETFVVVVVGFFCVFLLHLTYIRTKIRKSTKATVKNVSERKRARFPFVCICHANRNSPRKSSETSQKNQHLFYIVASCFVYKYGNLVLAISPRGCVARLTMKFGGLQLSLHQLSP